jgi:hypothetical protein
VYERCQQQSSPVSSTPRCAPRSTSSAAPSPSSAHRRPTTRLLDGLDPRADTRLDETPPVRPGAHIEIRRARHADRSPANCCRDLGRVGDWEGNLITGRVQPVPDRHPRRPGQLRHPTGPAPLAAMNRPGSRRVPSSADEIGVACRGRVPAGGHRGVLAPPMPSIRSMPIRRAT